MRILICLLYFLVLCGVIAAAPIDYTPQSSVPKKDETRTYWNGYKYGDHIHCMFGVGVRDDDGINLTDFRITIDTFADIDMNSGCVEGISVQETDLYLNGILYSPKDRVYSQEEMGSEIIRWYAFTGPCKLVKLQNGGYNLVSLDGDEYVARDQYGVGDWFKRCDQHDDSIYTQFTPRLKTLEQCRSLWKKEKSGEIKWNFVTRKYDPIPADKRKSITIERVDANNLPVIVSPKSPEIQKRMQSAPPSKQPPRIITVPH